jgi:hypothetical protein
MQEMLPNFCVFHVNAPGQEFGAEKLPEAYGYPSMEDLAEQVRWLELLSLLSKIIKLILVELFKLVFIAIVSFRMQMQNDFNILRNTQQKKRHQTFHCCDF